jgi:predicted DNA-binding protein (MmcQ/YjbR family)
MAMLSEKAILARLRKICLGLPEAIETVTFGHPTFQIRSKTFAVLEEYKDELGICLKVGELLQGVFLKDARFFRAPYIGKYGWVTLRVYAAPLNWTEVSGLVKGSYDLVVPRAEISAGPRKDPHAGSRHSPKGRTAKRVRKKGGADQILPGRSASS